MKLILCFFIAMFCAAVVGQITSGTIRKGVLVSTGRTPTTFTDTFNRADSDPMTTNASDGIGVWTDGPGALNPCKIALNILSSSSLGLDSGARVLYPPFRADQSASMTIGTVAGVGLMVRMHSSTNATGYLCAVDDSTHISIYRLVDVGFINYVLLGGTATVPTINALDTLTFTIVGDTMNVYVNGVSLGVTRQDGAYTSGQPGCYAYEFAGSIVDFFATEL